MWISKNPDNIEEKRFSFIKEALLGGGTHVPCLKFATSHVGISQDSYVACRNFVSEELCQEIWPCSIKMKL